MNVPPMEAPAGAIPVLLVAVGAEARARHAATLESHGYAVTTADVWPSLDHVNRAAVLITDVVSFDMLQHLKAWRLPPVVVLAGDAHVGVGACLRGADAWVPAEGDEAYLVDTVKGLTHTRARARAAAHAAMQVTEPSDAQPA